MQVADRRLRDLWPGTILTWWADAPAGDEYAHVVSMAWATVGVRSSIPEARREVRECLRLLGMLPRHRPATSADFARAKEAWRQHTLNQDIV